MANDCRTKLSLCLVNVIEVEKNYKNKKEFQ